MDNGINKIENYDLYARIKAKMGLDDVDASNYSPLTLAYIGDAIYELIIRTKIVSNEDKAVNKLHKKSSQLVKADSQCRMINAILEDLTEEESAVFRRGRNAKTHTKAKNATYSDYRYATGFEALMGYLYMKGRSERMIDLIMLAISRVYEEDK